MCCLSLAHVHACLCSLRIGRFALEFCKFSSVVCPKMRKKDKEQHERVCDYRLVACAHCREEVQHIRLAEHHNMCGLMTVACAKCGHACRRQALIAHWEADCPEHIICCQFAEDGCVFKGERRLYLAHLRDQLASHMSLLKDGCTNKMAQLKADYESHLLAQDERIALLERMVDDYGTHPFANAALPLAPFCHPLMSDMFVADTEVRWVLKNFSVARKKHFVQSERFPVAGCSFYVGAYPDGDSELSKGHLSLYLFLDQSLNPKQRISLRFALRIVNHRDPFLSVRKGNSLLASFVHVHAR